MKKVIYLSFLFVSLVIVTTSCEKEDPIDDEKITVNDLVGDWNFQSLTFNGVVYDTETELAELDATPVGDGTYAYIQISFLNVTTTELGLFDHRGNPPGEYGDNYTLSNNTINFSDSKFVFHIENWETFDGTVLKVKLVSSIFNTTPINGIYTMEFTPQ